jgi:hypothetical protein
MFKLYLLNGFPSSKEPEHPASRVSAVLHTVSPILASPSQLSLPGPSRRNRVLVAAKIVFIGWLPSSFWVPNLRLCPNQYLYFYFQS